MTKVLLGHKLGMTQLWDDKGRLIPGTVIAAPINTVTAKTDTQTTIGIATRGKTNQAQRQIAEILSSKRGIWLKTLPFSLDGERLDVGQFEVGEPVVLTGVTKGKGFAGVVKRHGFAGWPASHGHSHQRRPGSIGAQQPQRVVKGQKMAGRMGGAQLTVRSSKVLMIDRDQNLIVVSGPVPGPAKGRVVIRSKDKAGQ